jgi:PAS domain S-box-containing protein
VTPPLQILLLEDDSGDAELIREFLEAGDVDCTITRVQTRDEFTSALGDPGFDLILADYRLPSFDGLSALKLAQAARPDLPFIFVSGTLGEEVAIEALKIGATDYVLKTRLPRLVPSVQRALREARARAESSKVEEARKQAEKTLRAQADLLNLTHDAIYVRDMDGVITYWNRGAEGLYGWTAEEVKGRVAPELLKTVFPAPFERMTAALLRDGQWEGELLQSRRDGTQVVVASRWSLQRDAEGRPIAALVTNNDITDRKRAEEERDRLRQLEADLARMGRVSVMGELVASLAHEIKQPMAAAVLNAAACLQWLRRDAPNLAEAQGAASATAVAVKRAGDIIDRLSSLYRRGTPEREPVDLNEIVREITILLGDTARRNAISIQTELDVTLPNTIADRVQLQQVLMNLMLNGIEAMRDKGGELTIASKRGEHDQLLIAVRDLGVGLPDNDADRIFEAFFSTKPQGTGMGLSISRRIIESHGGRLWASPNAGAGATFQFTLPGDITASRS